MVFSSLTFTFLFLPITLIIYYLSKKEYRNYILLIASLIFYGAGEPVFVFVMIGSIVLNYLLALIIEKENSSSSIDLFHSPKFYLILDIVLNIGLLVVFKYLNLFIKSANIFFHTQYDSLSIALPIGISFFTFQSMSYVIDVYRKNVQAQRNPFYVALYISFFPQLIAGPIVRYIDIEKQITNRQESFDKFAKGMERFVLGFSKKIILANNLSEITKYGFNATELPSNGIVLWLSAISFTLQIYFDFSGYSDMAIGLGSMFGFDFLENFNYPYIAKSITDFWRRWHISLSSWFRDYVYIPLGGNRVSTARVILNLFIVWALTGLWHGADYTFIAWGLGYFILLIIEKYLVKPQRLNPILGVIWRIISLVAIISEWVIFNSPGISWAIRYILRMFGLLQGNWCLDNIVFKILRQYGFFLILGILLSTPIMGLINKLLRKSKFTKIVFESLKLISYVLMFLWAVSYIVLGSHNPFLYFNF